MKALLVTACQCSRLMDVVSVKDKIVVSIQSPPQSIFNYPDKPYEMPVSKERIFRYYGASVINGSEVLIYKEVLS